jgi:hypothetical protein
MKTRKFGDCHAWKNEFRERKTRGLIELRAITHNEYQTLQQYQMPIRIMNGFINAQDNKVR